MPVLVGGDVPFSALDLEVGYDPDAFRAIRVRATGEGRRGMLRANTTEPGLIRLSMASAEPIAAGAPIVQLELETLRRGRSDMELHVWSAAIDDRPVEGSPD